MQITRKQLKNLILREVQAIIERPSVDDLLDGADDFTDIDDDMSDIASEDKFPNTREEALAIARKIISGEMKPKEAADHGLHSVDAKGFHFIKRDGKNNETFIISKKELK